MGELIVSRPRGGQNDVLTWSRQRVCTIDDAEVNDLGRPSLDDANEALINSKQCSVQSNLSGSTVEDKWP